MALNEASRPSWLRSGVRPPLNSSIVWADVRRLAPLLGLFAGFSASCDGVLILNGRVVDEGGAPIVGARVSVYSANGEVLSDQHGCFHLFKVTSPTEHQAALLVQAPGRRTYLGTITSPSQQQVVVRLPQQGPDHYASMEKVPMDPSCPGKPASAAQPGVEPGAPPARGLAP